VTLHRWGGTASFLAIVWDGLGARAFEFSSAEASPVELALEGCDRLLDAGSDAGVRLALCEGAGELRLWQRANSEPAWTVETVLYSVSREPSQRFHGLAAHAGRVAIFGPAELLWRSARGAPWQTISLAPIDPELRLETGGIAAIGSDAVWIGYDRAEHGGALYRIPVGADGRLGAVERLIRLNVIGIQLAGDRGGVWVAGGLSHHFSRMAFLVQIVGSSIASIVAQDDRDSPALRRALSIPAHSLPSDTSFAAFSLSPEGRPLVMDPERGIYEFREDAFGMGSLRFAMEGMASRQLTGSGTTERRSYRDFLALSSGAFALATSDGEIVVLTSDGGPRIPSLPAR